MIRIFDIFSYFCFVLCMFHVNISSFEAHEGANHRNELRIVASVESYDSLLFLSLPPVP
jgi:hypothetical protein